ncbi:Type IV pili methyl-accepting chemotaxis transducer N-terminal domain-containing protein [Acanthopleuribacter pedis]
MWKTTSLNNRLIIVFAAIVATFAAVVGITAHLVAARTDDSLIINLAGRQRMLTQKYTKEMLASMRSGSDLATGAQVRTGAIHDPTVTRALFEDTLGAFLSGGRTYTDLVAKEPVDIMAVHEESARTLLKEVELKWNALVAVCEEGSVKFQNEGSLDAAERRKILEASVNCLKQMHGAVGELNRISDIKQARILHVMAGGLIWVLVLSLAALLFIRKRIFHPLEECVAVVEDIAAGNLQRRAPNIRDDEIGRLNAAVSTMSGNLVDMIKRLGESTTMLRSGAERFADFHQQTEQLQEMTAAVTASSEALITHNHTVAEEVTLIDTDAEKITASLVQIDNELKDLGLSTHSVTGTAATLSRAVEEISKTLGDISSNTERTQIQAADIKSETEQAAVLVAQLGQAAHEIGDVVNLIRGVAGQTNLLALNATIEAAAAGDAGKGFAVVAGEVKELAKKTESATGDIQKQVAAIQDKTRTAIVGIDRIVHLVDKLSADFSEVNDAIANQSHHVTEIAEGLNSNSNNLTSAMENIDQVGSEVASISGNLRTLTQRTHDLHRVMDESRTLAEAITEKIHVGETHVGLLSENATKAAGVGEELTQFSNQYREKLMAYSVDTDASP